MSTGSSADIEHVLKLDDVTVSYRQRGAWRDAARQVSMGIPPGQTCGLVGESGSGKTTLALAVMRQLPPEGEVRRGAILFRGRNILDLSQGEMRQIWGKEMAMVPQDARASLNPSMRIGKQAAELLRHHLGLNKGEARDRVLESFEAVKLGDPKRVAEAYPHQLSSGMLQRVLTAMALSTGPALLALDEPTSSLDVTTQSAMLDLFRELIEGRAQTSVLYITHNLGVVAQICDRVAVMYASELFEDAPTESLYQHPLHPYTRGLLDSVPRLGENKSQVDLRPIQGRIPSLDDTLSGCIFRPRCPLAIEVCKEHPPLYDCGDNHRSRCHRWEEIKNEKVSARQPMAEEHQARAHPETDTKPSESQKAVLQIEGMKVYFDQDRSLVERLRGEEANPVKAVNGISLSISRARTLGLVGESGSGKTTLARAIVGLAKRTTGSLRLFDMDVPPGMSRRGEDILCCLQIVFQDPAEALNPYLSVRETLRRPILRFREDSRQKADQIIDELLESVHLSREYASRLPGQLSGGEKQRIAIARAFAPNPALLIADEPVSSLDVSVQASILNLFEELQAKLEVATMFISHDLAVVGYLADEVAVIYLGQLMEISPADAVFSPPHHPYTEALLASVPLVDPEGEQEKIRLEGDIPSPSEEISGCPFHTRCPRFLGDICVDKVPPWRTDESSGKRYFCHIPVQELEEKQRQVFRFSSPESEAEQKP